MILISNDAQARPGDIIQFEDTFAAIAAGADTLAFRGHGYHILMGASLRLPVTTTFADWAEVVAALEELDPSGLPLDNLTRRYVTDIHHAFLTFARVRAGEPIDYLGQVSAYLGFDDIQIPDHEITVLQESIVGRCSGHLVLPETWRAACTTGSRRARWKLTTWLAYVPRSAASHEAARLLGIPVPRLMSRWTSPLPRPRTTPMPTILETTGEMSS